MRTFIARFPRSISIRLLAALAAIASGSVAAAEPAVATLVHRFTTSDWSGGDGPRPVVRGADGNYYGV